MKKTVIFDLDGTLVDIEPIFLKLFNQLSVEFGYAPILPEELPVLKKLHLKTLVFKRLGWRAIFLPKILKRGREEYFKLVQEVTLIPGITEVIQTLRDEGYRIGVVSSSEKATVTALLDRFGIATDFLYQSSLFGKAAVLKRVLREQSLVLSETVYVGDEVRDIDACQKAGLDIIAVTWGLNTKEALEATGAATVDTREALLARLQHKEGA